MEPFQLYTRLLDSLSRFTAPGNWKIKSVLLCLGVIFFFALPSYDRFFNDSTNDYLHFWLHLSRQAAHPFTLQPGLDPISHEAKTAFRLVPPLTGALVAWLSPMGGLYLMFLVQHLLGVGFLYVLISLVYRLTGDRLTAVLTALAFSLIYLTRAFFYELYGLFDGYAYFFLLLAMAARTPAGFVAALFLAFWTDERAIIASPLVLLFQLHTRVFPFTIPTLLAQWKWYVPYGLSAAAYLGIRIALEKYAGLFVPIGSGADAGLKLLLANFTSLPLATFLVFEGISFLILWLLFFFVKQKAWLEVLLTAGMLAAVWVVSGCVWDFTRSGCYAFPVVLTALYFMGKYLPTAQVRAVLVLALLLCVTIPTYKFQGFYYWQVPAPVKLVYGLIR